ncbi:SGNH/GDSL hydrolase family protein [Brunnivagina elsteri]|uniref:PEP-CTERM sorting domain-containing protein n=1 Tax=Brunnivagina elsteri CCALA 953 TaxID=987040 RepID=A0A2A2T9J3_9CYAN|nr:SGNH/GDSL hydrolase family protein [Calothrix elsteri]PAX45694.1 PEP-CTERM sorting domain-containing protein [Calothrix elsteri CCALA 953]
MKKQLLAAGIIAFSISLPSKASAASFRSYVFGDSLSDIGKAFALTGQGIPPAPYFNGRFSNGPVWVEYLSPAFGAKQTNYAIGGANTGDTNTLIPGNPLKLPGLAQQVEEFTATNPKVDEDALYILWAGANDYLGGGQTNPGIPVGNITNAVTSLAKLGAKNFLVANLPDLGKLPGTINKDFSTGLSTLTAFHNTLLNSSLTTLSQQLGLKMIQLDVNDLFSQAIATKVFANTTEPCLNLAAKTICSNPNDYLFWDDIHPTNFHGDARILRF